jgi:sirohydrochlorin cobaltochelatase
MHPHGYIGRKMQLPAIKETPAIVIAAFGSTTSARSALDIFEARLTDTFPDHEAVFARMKQQGLADRFRKAWIIPMMYFAGMHARDDLMGPEDSWRTVLETMGFSVDCPMVQHGQKSLFKGLAHYPEVIGFLLERLERTLALAACY